MGAGGATLEETVQGKPEKSKEQEREYREHRVLEE